MATRKQRRRKHDAAEHHPRSQRARLRSALDEALDGPDSLEREMAKRGYERDWINVGKWRRK